MLISVFKSKIHMATITDTLLNYQGSIAVDPKLLKAEVEQKLYQFINPLIGGSEGKGWPFGRDIYASDIFSLLQGVEAVDHVEDIRFLPVDILLNTAEPIRASFVLTSKQEPSA